MFRFAQHDKRGGVTFSRRAGQPLQGRRQIVVKLGTNRHRFAAATQVKLVELLVQVNPAEVNRHCGEIHAHAQKQSARGCQNQLAAI
jgi:hypothetical protein